MRVLWSYRNAIKFTNKGSVTLRCACETLGSTPAMNRLRVRFEVEDTGTGIDDRQQALLFEPFEMGSERCGGGPFVVPASDQTSDQIQT